MFTHKNYTQQTYSAAFSQNSGISGNLKCSDFDLRNHANFDQLILFLNSQNEHFTSAPLRTIEMDNCNLNDDKLKRLVIALFGHSRIEHINLRDNMITDIGSKILEEFTSKKHKDTDKIITVDLRDNQISEAYSSKSSTLILNNKNEEIDQFIYEPNSNDEENSQFKPFETSTLGKNSEEGIYNTQTSFLRSR